MGRVLLSGMMGAGKSTIGRALARSLGVPWVDLDAQIEQGAGMRIADLFATRGEAAFRELETSAVLGQLRDPSPRVVSLGGGALLEKGLRREVLENVLVVTLVAPAAVLSARIGRDASRPLVADTADGDGLEAKISEILESRLPAYSEAHRVIDTGHRSVESVVDELRALVASPPIPVVLGERSYAVDFAPHNAVTALEGVLSRLGASRVVVVTDDNVAPLWLDKLQKGWLGIDPNPVQVVLPAGERHKTLASVERILDSAIRAPIDRDAVLVALGGGVVTDMGGLAAALALRGIRWVGVPTTALAMVDASVGGKTAVDLGPAKNAIGAFHQPTRVVIDSSFCETESLRCYRGGLAEAFKTALLGDRELYRLIAAPGGAEGLASRSNFDLLSTTVRRSVAVKAGIVARDEREKGERAHLNLGHTVGHALEAEGGFERLTHGEAVSLGMVAALRVGVRLGLTPPAVADEIVAVLKRLLLPVDLDAEPVDDALRWVAFDKKRVGSSVRFILVREPGRVEIVRIPPADLPKLLDRPR